ncbi:MAG: hypothetical protein GY896_06370, partial [Gammaproteobacteria bacterium]|nr:hypothetical protein [Gammaproteobacteria bacterium]
MLYSQSIRPNPPIIAQSGEEGSRQPMQSVLATLANLRRFSGRLVFLSVLLLMIGGSMTAQASLHATEYDGAWSDNGTWLNNDTYSGAPGYHLAGKTVTINPTHRITFSGDDLYVESGTVNIVRGILYIDDHNVKME